MNGMTRRQRMATAARKGFGLLAALVLFGAAVIGSEASERRGAQEADARAAASLVQPARHEVSVQ